MLLRTSLADLIRLIRRLREKVRMVKPFYLGNFDAPVPPRELQLEILIDTRRNGAELRLFRFCQAARGFDCGDYPKGVFDSALRSSLQLVSEIEEVCRAPELNRTYAAIQTFYNYLTCPLKMIPRRSHVLVIGHHFRQLCARFAADSDIFYNVTSRRLLTGTKLARTRSSSHPISRLRKYTDRQEREILDFVECPSFDTGRVLNGDTCYSVARAADAWSKIKHPRTMPRTAEEFRRAYDSIKRRLRRK